MRCSDYQPRDGQFQVYPNYEEIKKYTGVLKPRNFEIFKKRLEEAGMIDQAHDFMMASGKWLRPCCTGRISR
ncbi:MAG: hypothetical protein ACLR6J_09230 [Parabacteroides merdae]